MTSHASDRQEAKGNDQFHLALIFALFQYMFGSIPSSWLWR